VIGLLDLRHIVHHHHLIIPRIVYFVVLVMTVSTTLAVFKGTTVAVNVLHQVLVKLPLEHRGAFEMVVDYLTDTVVVLAELLFEHC